MSGLFVDGFDVAAAKDVRVDGVRAAAVMVDGVAVWTPPPSGVLFDAVGAGSTSVPWQHTIGGNALLVAAVTVNANIGSNQAGTAAFKVGDTPIPLLRSVNFLFTSFQIGYGYLTATLWLFGLMNPPQDEQTITPTVNTSNHWEANSVSYNNVGGFGTPADVAGFGPTRNVACDTPRGGLGVAAIAGWRGSTTTTTTTTTTRGPLLTVATGISTVVVDLILTDAPDDVTSFTANGAGGANATTLGVIALPLQTT